MKVSLALGLLGGWLVLGQWSSEQSLAKELKASRHAFQKLVKRSNNITTKNEVGLRNVIPNWMMGLCSFKVISFSAAKRFPVFIGEALAPFTIFSSFYPSALFYNERSGLTKLWCDCQCCTQAGSQWWGAEQSRKSCCDDGYTHHCCRKIKENWGLPLLWNNYYLPATVLGSPTWHNKLSCRHNKF